MVKSEMTPVERAQQILDDSKQELECDHCDGKGVVPKDLQVIFGEDKKCWKCKGTGKVREGWPNVVVEIKAPTKFHQDKASLSGGKVGDWVSIRPCAEEHKDQTFLGIFLGALPKGLSGHVDKNHVLNLDYHMNPAIYVPDLKKVIYGCESWWGVIKSPDDLKKITDADINNVWYVKALKELGQSAEEKQEAT